MTVRTKKKRRYKQNEPKKKKDKINKLQDQGKATSPNPALSEYYSLLIPLPSSNIISFISTQMTQKRLILNKPPTMFAFFQAPTNFCFHQGTVRKKKEHKYIYICTEFNSVGSLIHTFSI